MTKKIQLRRMSLTDLDRVLDFFEEINPISSRDEISEWTKTSLKKYPQLCFVAIVEKQIIGAITGSLRYGVPFIDDFFVEEKYRRQEIGSRLLEQVLSELKLLQVDFVKVEANPSTWPMALKFYYRHGFRVCGVEQDRFGVGSQGDSVILKKLIK